MSLNVFAAISGADTAWIGFVAYLFGVFVLGWIAHRTTRKGDFVGEYFLGGRRLGAWALALTFAATAASGGSFVGFPALIYTHGWVMALWIAGYMVTPLVGMCLLGRRLHRAARVSGAITIPELIRHRLSSPGAGAVAAGFIVVFLFVFLLAQFKAGGMILTTLLQDMPLFQSGTGAISGLFGTEGWLGTADPGYLLSLMVFAGAVLGYVVYGGFRAVVWTDVMQGIVMVAGVIVLLILVLGKTGGVGGANKRLATLVPPTPVVVTVEGEIADGLPAGVWVRTADAGLVRLKEAVAGPGVGVTAIRLETDWERRQVDAEEIAEGVMATVDGATPFAYGADEPGVYMKPPGPDAAKAGGFLGVTMAMGFFVFWAFGTAGQPGNMVRLIAFKDLRSLGRALLVLTVVFTVIYVGLIVIFCAARVLYPGIEFDADRTMPETVLRSTAGAGVPWLAGFLLAAPFAAVMSSVDSFLLVVASSLVRDLFQSFIRPDASEKMLGRVSYLVTLVIGVAAAVFAVHPPEFLQVLIIFASEGLAATLLGPVVLMLFWKRMTGTACVASMFAGGGCHLLLYGLAYRRLGEFTVTDDYWVQPFVWDLVVCLIVGWIVALWTSPPEKSDVAKYF